MSSWFGSGKSAGSGGVGNDDDTNTGKINEQQKSNKKQQFPVVVELDEQVLLHDFVNPKKISSTTSSNNIDDNKTPLLIGSIDQGTSSTRFLVFTSTTGKICCSAQMEHSQIVYINQDDKVGWHEHDPIEIFDNTMTCIQAVQDALRQCKYANIIFANSSTNSSSESSSASVGGSSSISSTSATAPTGTGGKNAPTLAAVGLTNQRETTIAWNKVTGKPYYNAIVWDDTRTTGIADVIANGDVDRLRSQTGLPLASYFAGTKVKWLLDHVPQLAQDLAHFERQKQVAFGTIDSWLIYQLTGKPVASPDDSHNKTAINAGGLHVTDVTNASRWLFMDLKSLKWDKDLIATVCHPHDAQPILQAMPKICPSSHVFTVLQKSVTSNIPDLLDQVPLAAVLGDQQAALFGQCAFSPGQAKNTYGTGLFLMMNTGTKPIPSRHGLLTTVAYQMDDPRDYHHNGLGESSSSSDEENGHPVVYYALEGSVSHSGSTIQWLRDQLRIIDKASESETLARTTTHNDGMYFVPAFAGLFAPHWRSDARACMVGLTTTHHAGHVCRAALEAAAYQTCEVLQAIQADSQVQLQQLNVDGGATHNRLLMQFQADMANCPVVRPAVLETTALGAAFCAGLAVGVWTSLDQVQQVARQASGAEVYQPQMSMEEREKYWKGWQKAISKSLEWVDDDEDHEDSAADRAGGGANSADNLDFQDAVEQEDDGVAVPSMAGGGGGVSKSGGSADHGTGDDSGLFSTKTLVLITVVASVLGFILGRGCSGRSTSGSTRRFG